MVISSIKLLDKGLVTEAEIPKDSEQFDKHGNYTGGKVGSPPFSERILKDAQARMER